MTCHFSCGASDYLLAEAEMLRVTMEVLDGLELGAYSIKINHSAILEGIMQVCQVPRMLWQNLAKVINSLSKTSWDEVYLEMTTDLELGKAIVDEIGDYVVKTGGKHLLYDLLLDEELAKNVGFSEGISLMKNLFDLLETFEVMPKIAFDLSLAHPNFSELGFMWEVVTLPLSVKSGGKTIESTKIASGANYYTWSGYLHNAFSQFVGIEFELEEIFKIIQARVPADQVPEAAVDAYVMAIGEGFLKERMQVCRRLWDAGVKAEFSYKEVPEPTYQFAAAQKSGAPFAVVLSEGEIKQGKVKIKEVSSPYKPGLDVDIGDVGLELAQMIKERKEGVSDKKDADTEEEEEGGEDGNYRERVNRVRAQGGTVEMEGVNVEMDFARIKIKDAEIEFEGAKFDMKKVKIDIRGSKEK